MDGFNQIKWNGVGAHCEADYKGLSENFHRLLKNVEDICKTDLKGSLSMKKCQQLWKMFTREIKKCDPTPYKELVSKCKEGSKEGATIIQSITTAATQAAIWVVCLIYDIIKGDGTTPTHTYSQ